MDPSACLFGEGGPTSNLRNRYRPGEPKMPSFCQDLSQFGQLTQAPMTPGRTTRSMKRQSPLPTLTFDFQDMLSSTKRPKYHVERTLQDPLGLQSPMTPMTSDKLLTYDSSPEKRRMSKRLLGLSDNELETPEKRKFCSEPLIETPDFLTDNRPGSPMIFPNFVPDDYFIDVDQLNMAGTLDMDMPLSLGGDTSVPLPHKTPKHKLFNQSESISTPMPNHSYMSPLYKRSKMDDFQLPLLTHPTPLVEEVVTPPAKLPRLSSPLRLESMKTALVTPSGFRNSNSRDGEIMYTKFTNFMSYESFVEENWHPHMNFVIGENGAGKSAIQTGVMLALGAKSCETGRARSLKKFVKRGKTQAKVEIKLSNFNGTANKEKYGEVITLIRTISQNGTSKSQVQLASGELTTINSQGLDLILKPLMIHVNNPLVILTQTNARQFLKSANPKNIFARFCDAMLITESRSILDQTNINIQDSQKMLLDKEETHFRLVQKRSELQEQLHSIMTIESYPIQCAAIENELNWSKVIETEEKLAKLKAELEEVDTSIEKVKAEIAKSENEIKAMDSGLHTEGSALKKLEKDYQALESKLKESSRGTQAANCEKATIQTNIKVCEGFIKKKKAVLEEKSRTDKKMDNTTSNKEDHERKKRETEKKIKTYNDKINEGYKELETLNSKMSKLEGERDVCLRTESDHQHNKRKLERALANKLNAQKTQYDRFGPLMKILVQRIKQNKWASDPPLGPMGACFTVKDPQYCPMVEYILSDSLHRFFVDNQKDVDKLKRIIKEVYGAEKGRHRPNITLFDIKKDTVLDLREGKAVIDGYPTVLDVLDIKDPIVTRVLVDENSIERVLLFKSYKEACSILKHTHKVPKTCVYGFSQDWYKITPPPSYGAKAQNIPHNTVGILQTTKSDSASQVENDVKRLQKELNNVTGIYQDAQKNTQSVQKLIGNCEKSIKKKTDELSQWKLERYKLEKSIAEQPDVTPNNNLIEDFGEEQESISAKQAELEEWKKKFNANEVIIKEKKKEHQDLKKQMAAFELEKEALKNENATIKKKQEKYRKSIEDCKKDLIKLNSNRDSLKSQCSEVEKNLSKKISEAQEKGERVETNRSPNEIKSDLESLTTMYNKNRDKIKDKERIQIEYDQVSEEAEELKGRIANATSVIKTIESIHKCHSVHLEIKKHGYFYTTRNNFVSLIQLRGFSGDMDIDWKEGTLTYFVSRDLSSQLRAQTNFVEGDNGQKCINNRRLKDYNAGLSGGERSFATFCVLTGVWMAMPSPFFMMDEFDVYLDVENRRKCQDILIQQAKIQPDAQFFVFTPETLYQVPNDEAWYRFRRLPKPIRKRNQEPLT